MLDVSALNSTACNVVAYNKLNRTKNYSTMAGRLTLDINVLSYVNYLWLQSYSRINKVKPRKLHQRLRESDKNTRIKILQFEIRPSSYSFSSSYNLYLTNDYQVIYALNTLFFFMSKSFVFMLLSPSYSHDFPSGFSFQFSFLLLKLFPT